MADDNIEEVGVRLTVDGQTAFSSQMSAAAASIYQLGLAADEANASAAAAGKGLDDVGSVASTATPKIKSAGAELTNTSAAAKDFRSALSDAKSDVTDFTSGIGGLTSAVTDLASTQLFNYNAIGVVTTGLLGAGAAATYFGLKTQSGMEQANMAFTQFLGSADKANAFMAQLKNFAATTPFDFQNLVPTAQRLLNTGDDPTQALTDLKAIGDAASGADPMEGQQGVNRIALAISQIKMAPKLKAQDMNQLVQAGIDPYGIIANATGKSKGQVVTDEGAGKIPGDQAAKVLLQGFEQRYGGLMTKENSTLTGQLSNLHDTISFQLADATKPLATLLERDMPTITKGLTSLGNLYKGGLDATIKDFQLLNSAWKSGGMDGVMKSLGNLTGTGNTFETIWTHIKDDSVNIADIWENSLWPAIKDVAHDLEPLVGGALWTLEQALQWMANNPGAAKDIFEGLAMTLITYKIADLIGDITKAVLALRDAWYAGAIAAQVFGGASKDAAVPIAVPKGGSTVVKDAEGAAKGGGGILAGILGAPEVAAAVGGYYGGKVLNDVMNSSSSAWDWLNFQSGGQGDADAQKQLDLYNKQHGLPASGASAAPAPSSMNLQDWLKASGQVPGQAAGGTTLRAGSSLVGENGPEILNLPVGATVVPLDKAKPPPNTVVFNQGAIQINGVNMDTSTLVDTLIEEIQNQLARQ